MRTSSVHPLEWGIILFCMVSLAFGLGWLEVLLPGGFPLGTLATWAMLMLLGSAWVRLAPRMTRRRQAAILGLILAICWYPFSWFKAGNPALTFHGDSGPWVVWTAAVALWLLVVGLWTGISAVRRRQR